MTLGRTLLLLEVLALAHASLFLRSTRPTQRP
jgi:hypothetical protein